MTFSDNSNSWMTASIHKEDHDNVGFEEASLDEAKATQQPLYEDVLQQHPAAPHVVVIANEEEGEEDEAPKTVLNNHSNASNDPDALAESTSSSTSPTATIPWYKFYHDKPAQGYVMVNGIGFGIWVMSNIFLASSLLYLASQEAGCIEINPETGEETVQAEDCTSRVHGMKPAALISNIAVISGVLSALFMPLMGAIIDYTPYRKHVGSITAAAMIVIHTIQIGTISQTWCIMSILQAAAGVLYQIENMATRAYLPDTARNIGECNMTNFTANNMVVMFGTEILFLIVIIAISTSLGLDDVMTAHVSQSISVLFIGAAFAYGWWYLFPHVPPKHYLLSGTTQQPERQQHSLLLQGFVQVYHTALEIQSKYKHGLRWYFLALIFGESAANTFVLVAVVFLSDQLNMSASEIGIFFVITLLCGVPGARLGAWITAHTTPNRSWQLCMICIALFASGGAIVLDHAPQPVAYLWGAGMGALLGWFYPVEDLYFSMCLPAGQETEMAGFFIYCTQIMAWLPPLIFSAMVEANVSQSYAVVATSSFFIMGAILLSFSAPWPDVLKESGRD